jgi:hypothetical protein
MDSRRLPFQLKRDYSMIVVARASAVGAIIGSSFCGFSILNETAHWAWSHPVST